MCRPLSRNHILFYREYVEQAIKASDNSTSFGPDAYTPANLKRVGNQRVEYLRSLANLSLHDSDLPAIWKQAMIIVLPKYFKSLTTSSLFCQISLLLPAP